MEPRATTLPVILLLACSAALAHARPEHHDADGRDGGSAASHEHERRDKEKRADSADEEEREDAGPRIKLDLTPAQSEFRDKLVDQQRLFVRDLARSHGDRVAPAVRQAIGVHWRRVMRLLRIRELAERDNDATIVHQVDDLRDREDERFVAVMQPTGGAAAADGGKR